MDEINRRYIDARRAHSERSHPTYKAHEEHPAFYNKNQEIVKTSARHIKYAKFSPGI